MLTKMLFVFSVCRFLADADWDTVEKSCEIDDPYLTTEEEADVEDSLDVRPNSICPECDAKLPAQYTRKELREMTNEAILRMLKAEKVPNTQIRGLIETLQLGADRTTQIEG